MTTHPRPALAPAVTKYTVDNGPMVVEMRSAPNGLQQLGGGVIRFDQGGRCDPWRLPYEEVLCVIEGTLRVHVGETVLTGAIGDVLTIPRGSEVIYEGEPGTRAFYALTPSDWYREHPNGL